MNLVAFPGRQALINGSASTISCNANLPIDYCWFRKPNGEILSISDKMTPEMDAVSHMFSYHGLGFGLGECGITLKEVNSEVLNSKIFLRHFQT